MTAATYARVSTADQNLDRQLRSTHDYATDTLDIDLKATTTFRDQSTGTNTSRSSYRKLMESVESGDIGVVIIKSVSLIARSIRDLDRTAERVKDAGAELHIIDEGLVLKPDEDDPYQNAFFACLGCLLSLRQRLLSNELGKG